MKILCKPCGPLGANMYAVYNEQGQALLIDPSDANAAQTELQSHDLTPMGVLFTHAHFDHVAPIASLKAFIKAPFFLHSADEPLLNHPEYNASFLVGQPQTLGVCDSHFEDQDCLLLGSFSVRTLHTPGHTPGSSCFLLEDKLFTGDTLFASGIGRCDLYGGDMAAMRASLRKLAALEDDLTVYPGHGASSLLALEKRYNPYFIHQS